jgi:hypothetical protein
VKRITDTLRENLCTFLITYRRIFLIVRSVSNKVVDNFKIHVLCLLTSFVKMVPFLR